MSDSLERQIVDKLIESCEARYLDTQDLNKELLMMLAKYKSRLGEDSWMQRQYNKGKSDYMLRR